MARPRRICKIGLCIEKACFKPDNVRSADLCYIEVTAEEAEALRLKNITGLNQTQSAKKMGISQSTFQRILSSAYKKTSEALIGGKAIRIAHQDMV
jgi:predicted DNA-binding protein (UPF0251 family)